MERKYIVEVNMATVETIVKEAAPIKQVKQIVKLLGDFRNTFIEKTTVKGRCILPGRLVRLFGSIWKGYGNIELRYGGTSISSNAPYECIFRKADGSWAGINLNDVITLKDYEQLLFGCWSYTDGSALDANGSDELCVMNWVINQDSAAVLEKMAHDIEMLIISLSHYSYFEECVKKISDILHSVNSERLSYRIPWTFVKELDEIIEELELSYQNKTVWSELDDTVDMAYQHIPYEYRTSPMSRTKLAKIWGGDMTYGKIKQMIESGRLNVEQIEEQKYVFDIRQIPPHVQGRFSEMN
jgi:hypothetical protein